MGEKGRGGAAVLSHASQGLGYRGLADASTGFLWNKRARTKKVAPVNLVAMAAAPVRAKQTASLGTRLPSDF